MGDGGDELGLHALRLLDISGHIVDGVREIADLVVKLLLHLNAVAAGGDALGRGGDGNHGLHNGSHKVGAGDINQAENNDAHSNGQTADEHDLAVHQTQGGDVAHDPHHVAIVYEGGGNRHDPFPGGRIVAHPVFDPLALFGQGDVRRVRSGT